MPPDAITETVALLESLSRRAAELAAALPSLDLGAEALAGPASSTSRTFRARAVGVNGFSRISGRS